MMSPYPVPMEEPLFLELRHYCVRQSKESGVGVAMECFSGAGHEWSRKKVHMKSLNGDNRGSGSKS